MYHPIIKNKLNELKGMKQVNELLDYMPIIELVDTKIKDLSNFINFLMDDKANSIEDIIHNKHCYIDLPTYIENEIIATYDLKDSDNKYNFFVELDKAFRENSCKNLIPIISFDHYYETPRKSSKENINFAKKIIDAFDNFAIRLFADSSFRNDDYTLLWQLYDFYGETISDKATLIFDIDKTTESLTENLIKEIIKEFKIKKIIFSGEVLKDNTRDATMFDYDRLSNNHLLNYQKLKKKPFLNELNINYSDYTLADKIPSKIDIDPEKGFKYYPFIKFTTEDAKICMFTADSKGNYEQYQELCTRVVSQIRNFLPEHCSTCQFIYDIAKGSDSISYKAGSVWKHRMITHHITTMAMCKII